MRTAIFFGLAYIGDAIFKLAGVVSADIMSDKLVTFYSVLMIAFIIMDVIDFLRSCYDKQ